MNRRDVYNKYDGHCAYCGTRLSPLNWGKPPRGKGDDMTIGHIVPSSKWKIYSKLTPSKRFVFEGITKAT